MLYTNFILYCLERSSRLSTGVSNLGKSYICKKIVSAYNLLKTQQKLQCNLRNSPGNSEEGGQVGSVGGNNDKAKKPPCCRHQASGQIFGSLTCQCFKKCQLVIEKTKQSFPHSLLNRMVSFFAKDILYSWGRNKETPLLWVTDGMGNQRHSCSFP